MIDHITRSIFSLKDIPTTEKKNIRNFEVARQRLSKESGVNFTGLLELKILLEFLLSKNERDISHKEYT